IFYLRISMNVSYGKIVFRVMLWLWSFVFLFLVALPVFSQSITPTPVCIQQGTGPGEFHLVGADVCGSCPTRTSVHAGIINQTAQSHPVTNFPGGVFNCGTFPIHYEIDSANASCTPFSIVYFIS